MSSSNTEDNVIRVDFRNRRRVDSPEEPTTNDQAPQQADLQSTLDAGEGPPQLAVFERWIDEGIVTVTLDSRHPDVQVPDEFRNRLQLNLNFSHRFMIDDFEYDEVGVRASLSFNQVPTYCDVPWTAVYAISSTPLEETCLFATSAPPELLAALAEQAGSGFQER